MISTKADKTALDKETADRKASDAVLGGAIVSEGVARAAGDAALNNKIDKNAANQSTKDASQDVAINGKVDKSQYNNDKIIQGIHDTLQDAAIIGLDTTKADKSDLNKEIIERKAADNALKSNIDQNKAEQAVTDAKQDKALSDETSARVDADTALNTKIDSNKAAQKVTDDAQDAVINTKASKKDLTSEVAERKSADTKLQKNINREANTRAQADAVLSSRIDNNDATLVQHDERITSNTQRVGAVEGRVSNLEQSTNKRFSQMDKRIGDNRKLASAGIAGAGAMANIPQVSQGSTFSVGAGVGGYDSEQAVAVGFSARVNNNVVTKMSVSTNTQSEILWGAGVGVEW